FLATGIRRSELLGIKVKDLNPRTQEVAILRRPDDILDPRPSEPNTKTRDRLLPLPSALYPFLKNYLLLRHDACKGKHDFLFATPDGKPLSKAALNRLFKQLREISPPNTITPHVLRHTYFES